MDNDNSSKKHTSNLDKDNTFRNKRRSILKAFAGIPVLGLLGYEVLKKTKYDKQHNKSKDILDDLGLKKIKASVRPVTVVSGGDVIRIGIIGTGSRGIALLNGLGFMPKPQFLRSTENEQIATQAKYGNLNVVVTGVCDVFDQHAEQGLAAAQFDIYTRGDLAGKFPVKRYRHYHDMLNDKDIDAVIIATPDHHHARMTIEAIKAGKHVYCEKAPVRRENEIYELYDTVKDSGLVYQLGHQVPQNAVFQQAREVVKKELLGKISHIETSTNRNTPHGAWIRHIDANGNLKPGSEKEIDWKQWLGDSPYVPFSVRRYYDWARYFAYDTGLIGQLFSHEFDAVNQLLDIGIPHTVSVSGGQFFYTEFGDIPDILDAAFVYPDKGLMLTYNANLASSRTRERTIYGKDASMTLGGDLTLTPDGDSKKYAKMIKNGLVDPSRPMLVIKPGNKKGIDALSSATSLYYASRGLTSTSINGKVWDVTYLHLKEWIDCIRNGGEPSANIDKAFEEGITIAMADISYREKCRARWDVDKKKIVRL